MNFIDNLNRELCFEETQSATIFHPHGKMVAGETESYVIPTNDDKLVISRFLKKQLIASFLTILTIPLQLFGISFILRHCGIPYNWGIWISLVIMSICLLFFKKWGEKKIKQITTGYDVIIVERSQSRAINNVYALGWRMKLMTYGSALFMVIEGMLLMSLLNIK